MTKERLAEIKAVFGVSFVRFCREAAELISAVESLMAENAALRNFASPTWSTPEEDRFWAEADRQADEELAKRMTQL